MRLYEYLDIGARLKEARALTGLKQKEMANKLGLSPSAYSNYENGYSEPSVDLIKEVCYIAQITVNEFLKIEISQEHRTPRVETFADLIQILVDLDKRGMTITKREVEHEGNWSNRKSHALVTLDFLSPQLAALLPDWHKKNLDLKNGIITEEEYNKWINNILSIYNIQIDEYL